MLSGKDLLDVLDIVRNEAVYKERLEALRKAEADLQEAKFIAATVFEAKAMLDKAKVVKEEAETYSSSTRSSADTYKQTIEDELQVKLVQLKKDQLVATSQLQEAREVRDEHREQAKVNLGLRESLKQIDADLTLRENELKRQNTELRNRTSLVRELINKDL